MLSGPCLMYSLSHNQRTLNNALWMQAFIQKPLLNTWMTLLWNPQNARQCRQDPVVKRNFHPPATSAFDFRDKMSTDRNNTLEHLRYNVSNVSHVEKRQTLSTISKTNGRFNKSIETISKTNERFNKSIETILKTNERLNEKHRDNIKYRKPTKGLTKA